jgi:hypothetical protein
MVKSGAITKNEIDNKHFSYVVNSAVKTVKPANNSTPLTPIYVHSHQRSVSDLAKDFYWETNSDSLHEFVKWIDEKELGLRGK